MLKFAKAPTKEQLERVKLEKAWKDTLQKRNIAKSYMEMCEADYYDSAVRNYEALEARMMAIWREVRRMKA